MSTTQKIKQHFVIVEKSRKINRTYGGSKYTLGIYENQGAGKLNWIGEVSADTRGHKGEISEAYGKILELKAIKPALLKTIKKAASDPANKNYSYLGYYSWSMEEKFGLKLQQI